MISSFRVSSGLVIFSLVLLDFHFMFHCLLAKRADAQGAAKRRSVPRFGEFSCCCCLSLLPGLARSIHATWGLPFSRTLQFSRLLRFVSRPLSPPTPSGTGSRAKGKRQTGHSATIDGRRLSWLIVRPPSASSMTPTFFSKEKSGPCC